MPRLLHHHTPLPLLLPLLLHHLLLLLPASAANIVRRHDDEDTTSSTAAAVNTTTCNGRFYAYTELAGYGYVPGDARDRFGDTIGGIGSAVALEPGSWARSGDGAGGADGSVYTGVLWALPDRGW